MGIYGQLESRRKTYENTFEFWTNTFNVRRGKVGTDGKAEEDLRDSAMHRQLTLFISALIALICVKCIFPVTFYSGQQATSIYVFSNEFSPVLPHKFG